jgi:galactitol-specific phosphotransferase system IIC component
MDVDIWNYVQNAFFGKSENLSTFSLLLRSMRHIYVNCYIIDHSVNNNLTNTPHNLHPHNIPKSYSNSNQ